MSIADGMLAEYEMEAANTRKLLERVPESEFDWKPHPKSMSLGDLAAHLAQLHEFGLMTMNEDQIEFDPAAFVPFKPKSRAELLKRFDDGLAAIKSSMKSVADEKMMKNWKMTMKGGPTVIDGPRVSVMRGMIMNHIYHHRGQLTVYLRLKDVPLPAMYGPSADEQ